MKKSELQNKVTEFNGSTKEALETIINALNKGQRQKLMKNEAVVAILARYGIEIEE